MQNKNMNIIFLLSDNQGAWALGCTGNQEIITPNLDRLAGEGHLGFLIGLRTSPAEALIIMRHFIGMESWLRNRVM